MRLILRYDGLFEAVPAHAEPVDVLGQGLLLKQACVGAPHATCSWCPATANCPVNEVASRITRQAIRGDAVLCLADSPACKWSAALDPARTYTQNQLLRLERALSQQRRGRASVDGAAGREVATGALAGVLSRKRPHSASPARAAGKRPESARTSADLPGAAALQHDSPCARAAVLCADTSAATAAATCAASHPLHDWPLLSPRHGDAGVALVAPGRPCGHQHPQQADRAPPANAAPALQSSAAEAARSLSEQRAGTPSSVSSASAVRLHDVAAAGGPLHDDASTAPVATPPAGADSNRRLADGAQGSTGTEPAVRRAGERAHVRPWAALPRGPLEIVLQHLDCSALIAASGACHAWRTAVLQDRAGLRSVRVRLNERRPLRWGQHGAAAAHAGLGMRVLQRAAALHVPAAVQAAADRAGNGGACMACASVLRVRGDANGASRYWKKAAKAGHAGAMFELGLHYYKGDVAHLGRDAEDALMWLGRYVASADRDAAAAPPPPARQEETRRETERLAHARLILGYLHLDGEGTRRDNGAAVKHLRAAAELGSAEAQATLGWMYNTGQFGAQ